MFEADLNRLLKNQRLDITRALEPIQRQMRDVLDGFLDTMSEQRRLSQQRLWKRGWMIDLHFPFLLVEKAIEEGKATDADLDDLLVDHYSSREADIEFEVCGAWPDRVHVLSVAFDRHRNADFLSSIPIMLAQADGMATHLVDAKFFGTAKKRPKIAKALEDMNIDWKRYDSLTILEVVNGLNGPDDDLVPGVMNRHRVMHGLDVDYGTEANSYRAIAILQFVTHFVKPAAESLK